MKVGVVLGTVGGSAGDIRGGAGFPCSLLSPPHCGSPAQGCGSPAPCCGSPAPCCGENTISQPPYPLGIGPYQIDPYALGIGPYSYPPPIVR